ncbi:Oidioi.mRNA.OKI2018_I69.PAR.g9589.t1.cds [Oikopleura dioica]|uniref:Oidioi.mRNA.OKI2018_I69.PAR.g9589.t1.cds n=1 Tax=Oikopleura dioica TaxID=34765 RepID=A0ABN7RU07_OIKDI|nr:Oidioi.mRNA.OKI2018_I69.PAR.g9589.t1.cds [Oikopleura dioica]
MFKKDRKIDLEKQQKSLPVEISKEDLVQWEKEDRQCRIIWLSVALIYTIWMCYSLGPQSVPEKCISINGQQSIEIDFPRTDYITSNMYCRQSCRYDWKANCLSGRTVTEDQFEQYRNQTIEIMVNFPNYQNYWLFANGTHIRVLEVTWPKTVNNTVQTKIRSGDPNESHSTICIYNTTCGADYFWRIPSPFNSNA